MIYTYRCPVCGAENHSTSQTSKTVLVCRLCGLPRRHQRVWGFSHKPSMPDHFNPTIGAPVSNMAQFTSELHRQSDERNQVNAAQAELVSNALGTKIAPIEHSFAPIDLGDAHACGATNEGIPESNESRKRTGAPLLPEIR